MECRYLRCQLGHSTYYANVDEMPNKCPKCGAACYVSFLSPEHETKFTIIYVFLAMLFLVLMSRC